jgi:Putative peptidoglycan-binding domain-containing protein
MHCESAGNRQSCKWVLCVLIILLVGLFSFTALAQAYPYETKTIDKVNMRRFANDSAVVLERIDKGASVTILGESGDYYEISYNGRTGFAMKQYVTGTVVTATPAPVQAAPSAYTTKQLNDEGDEVYAIQLALAELNYLTGAVDGKFGSATQAAVKALQSGNGLPETGAVDPNLQALLFTGQPKNKSGVKTKLQTLSPLKGTIIRANNVGKAVQEASIRLKALSYYMGEIGITYNKDMVAATKEFQKKNGLTADGTIGEQTAQALYAATAIPKGSDQTPAPSPTPTVYKLPTSTVENGSKGDDARLVQQRLKELGYFAAEADGVFGTKSVTALKAFQAANKIKEDGICGKTTATVLFSDKAIAVAPVITPAPTPVPTPIVITKENCITVKIGVSGEPVLNLQKRLTSLGYYSARNDGQYLADDMAAVMAFQNKAGLKADGIAGYDTQSLLYSDAAVGPDGVNTTFTTLRQGNTGAEVTQMQQKLIDLKYLAGSADGKYGAKTAQAVADFQRASGLVRDGIAGAKTLTLLYSSNPSSAPVATPAPGSTTVREGDKNDAVKQMQQRLIELGYLTGKADGTFGPKTLAALISFQTKSGLSADGVAGQKTWVALTSAKEPNVTPTVKPGPTTPRASQVQYENWYTTIRSKAKQYRYATVYDYSTGISWQVDMFSLGAHADAEPLTAQDTANMLKAFGGQNTWTAKPVWVVFGDGTVFMGSTHSFPHDPQHIKNNNFDGHICIHFPRTQAQVEAIGPYATSHQVAIDKGWAATQKMK